MMGHGKHDNCTMCSMGKAIGMIEKCTDKNCTHPSHKKEKEQEHSMMCSKCGLKAKTADEQAQHSCVAC